MIKWDYSLVKQYVESKGYKLNSKEYIKKHGILEFTCPQKHIFPMSFNNFYKGQRCPKCKQEKSRKYSNEKIQQIVKEFGCEFKGQNYKSMKDTLEITCVCKGSILTTMQNLESGVVCKKCGFKTPRLKEKKVTPSEKCVKHSIEYLDVMVSERGETLLTSVDEYGGNKSKLKIQCKNKEHEPYLIRFDSYKRGSGCKECMKEKMALKQKDVEDFVNGIGYKLKSNFRGTENPITVECNKRHSYNVLYHNLKKGSRCPYCEHSSGEQEVLRILDKYKINFKIEYRFEDCRNKRPLPFDFYLPDHNICIEYDGIFHYEMITGFDRFVSGKINDSIKNWYCKENGIKLIRIPYWDFKNIEAILVAKLNIDNK